MINALGQQFNQLAGLDFNTLAHFRGISALCIWECASWPPIARKRPGGGSFAASGRQGGEKLPVARLLAALQPRIHPCLNAIGNLLAAAQHAFAQAVFEGSLRPPFHSGLK